MLFLSEVDIEKLNEISKLFEKIQKIESTFSDEVLEKIHGFHNSEQSLMHAIRWGSQAADDLQKVLQEKVTMIKKEGYFTEEGDWQIQQHHEWSKALYDKGKEWAKENAPEDSTYVGVAIRLGGMSLDIIIERGHFVEYLEFVNAR